MPAASSGKLFSTAGSMFAGLFNNNFGKVAQTGLAGAFQRGLGRITGQFQSLGKSSASSFATGFSGYIGAGGLGTYLRLGRDGPRPSASCPARSAKSAGKSSPSATLGVARTR